MSTVTLSVSARTASRNMDYALSGHEARRRVPMVATTKA